MSFDLTQNKELKMNVLIIKTSEHRIFAEEIGGMLSKIMEINNAFSACCDCRENGEAIESITVIFNGKIFEYMINDGIQEFFKTI